jgi:hypothetical protein
MYCRDRLGSRTNAVVPSVVSPNAPPMQPRRVANLSGCRPPTQHTERPMSRDSVTAPLPRVESTESCPSTARASIVERPNFPTQRLSEPATLRASNAMEPSDLLAALESDPNPSDRFKGAAQRHAPLIWGLLAPRQPTKRQTRRFRPVYPRTRRSPTGKQCGSWRENADSIRAKNLTLTIHIDRSISRCQVRAGARGSPSPSPAQRLGPSDPRSGRPVCFSISLAVRAPLDPTE